MHFPAILSGGKVRYAAFSRDPDLDICKRIILTFSGWLTGDNFLGSDLFVDEPGADQGVEITIVEQ